MTWKELESTKGTYDFSAIEAANNFAYWKSKGVKVVFRFILDSPTGQAHRDIPDWLYNDMIARGESPGTVYNDTTGGWAQATTWASPQLRLHLLARTAQISHRCHCGKVQYQ